MNGNDSEVVLAYQVEAAEDTASLDDSSRAGYNGDIPDFGTLYLRSWAQ